MQTPSLFPSERVGESLAKFEQLVVSNSGEDAFDVAVRLLSAKLVDEVELREGKRHPEFATQGHATAVHGRIEDLYKRAIKRWPDLDGNGTSLGVLPKQLASCLPPLVGWSILQSDLSHLDAVLERLVAREAKGQLGQYFTPRDVVRLCVAALNPCPKDRIMDPACGSGGFLYEAVRYSQGNYGASPHCLGIDIGAKALKVACLLSHAVGSDAIRVCRANSIDGREYRKSCPPEWAPFETKESAGPWGAWHGLRCSLLLTNPPFAGDIEDAEVLAAYESLRGASASRKGSVGREHLFVERAVNLLEPGGRLAMVVPQGILANATSAYLRRWLISECRVLAVVGLHPYAFLPYTGVKASLLFVEKPSRKGGLPQDYPIAFVTSRAPGKDSSGRVSGASDYEEIANALAEFFRSQHLAWARRKSSKTSNNLETVSLSETVGHDRLDAGYYDSELRRLYFDLREKTERRVGDIVARSIERFRRSGVREIDYVDISCVDPKTGVVVPSRLDASDAPSRASYVVKAGDVLVSTVRPERNVVALIKATGDVPMIASNGFCLLRPHGIAPELLYLYCKSETFRRLLARRATATMYPAVTDRDVLDMPFVDQPRTTQVKMVGELQKGLALLDEAKTRIGGAVAMMELFIEGQAQENSQHSSTPQSSRDHAKTS